MASPELDFINQMLRDISANSKNASTPTVEQQRSQMSDTMLELAKDASTEDIQCQPVDIEGVPARWFEASGTADDGVVLYFHGGGYVLGSLKTHAELMGRCSRACGVKVLGVDYRLAPENIFPAAVEDGVKSYRWLLDQDIDPQRIMLAGDSAGGGLVMATILSLRDQGLPLPVGATLFSPWVDLTMSGASMESRRAFDPIVTPEGLHAMATLYRGDVEASQPLISPLFADLSKLPPLLIQVGDYEVLLSDSQQLAAKAKAAGVAVTYQEWEKAFHVFHAVPALPESADALQSMGDFYRQLVGSS
tara:strand:- start:3003 stop:3917 length:915 start_codon:yes stop_codon:yes gene_type:complete